MVTEMITMMTTGKEKRREKKMMTKEIVQNQGDSINRPTKIESHRGTLYCPHYAARIMC